MAHDANSSTRPTNGPCNGDSGHPSPITKHTRTTSIAEAPAEPLPRSTPSISRILIPTPSAAGVPSLTPRLSTATAPPSPTDTNAHPSPVGGGPTSTSYVVPPRPKPGRKPATDEPASKRKAQNRESQRAFRARKAAKLSEMQQQVHTTEAKYKNKISEKITELAERDMRIKELEARLEKSQESEKRLAQERDYWKARVSQDQHSVPQFDQALLNSFGAKSDWAFPATLPDAQQATPTRGSISSLTEYNTPPSAPDMICGKCEPGGRCACFERIVNTPPMNNANPWMAPAPLIPTPGRSSGSPVKQNSVHEVDIYADREIDFTAQFASKQPHHHNRPSIAFLTDAAEDNSRCGFCTDDTNCLCRDKSLQQPEFQQQVEVAPGGCAECQANPQQKAWCQRVAQLRSSSNNAAFSPVSRDSSIANVLETMEPQLTDPYASRPSIGCNEAFKLLEGRVPMDQDKMDWISQLRPVSHERRDTLLQSPFRTYSALEIDTAGVIATLGNTMQPIQPRPSDGENASLVRIAQQQQIQKHTESPEYGIASQLHMSSLGDATAVPMEWQ